MGEFRSSSEEDLEDDEEEDGEIIGFLENPNMVAEIGTTLAEEGASVEDEVTDIVSMSNENQTIVEGAMRRASSGDFFTRKGSITETVLSIENVTSVSSKKLTREKVSGKYSNDGDNDELKFEPEDHYHQIIPLYHNNVVDVGKELIDTNLSAISMTPESHKTRPRAHQTGSRNSFRNIFRPDLTYCEGSAKCLKSTLIRQLSHSSASSGGSSHAHMIHLLDQEHHDVTAHHSDEEVVHTDDVEGVCQWPKGRAFKVHQVVNDVVAEQDEPSEGSNDVTTESGDQEGHQESERSDEAEEVLVDGDAESKKEDEPIDIVISGSVSLEDDDNPGIGKDSDGQMKTSDPCMQSGEVSDETNESQQISDTNPPTPADSQIATTAGKNQSDEKELVPGECSPNEGTHEAGQEENLHSVGTSTTVIQTTIPDDAEEAVIDPEMKAQNKISEEVSNINTNRRRVSLMSVNSS